MNKKVVIVALLAALPLVAVGSGVAYARWGHGDRMERAQKFIKWRVNDMLEEIDATDEQSSKVNTVVDGLMRDALPMIEEHHRAKGEFHEMLFSDALDPETLHKAVDARIAEFTEFAHKAADAAVELHGTLTPEQRDELREMLPRRHH
ncbi:MAG: periplasmic heavy metal sensor [Myxococcota bacterium]